MAMVEFMMDVEVLFGVLLTIKIAIMMIVLEVHTFKVDIMNFEKLKIFFITKILKEQAYLFSLEIMI